MRDGQEEASWGCSESAGFREPPGGVLGGDGIGGTDTSGQAKQSWVRGAWGTGSPAGRLWTGAPGCALGKVPASHSSKPCADAL
jgi:hypothetical protein